MGTEMDSCVVFTNAGVWAHTEHCLELTNAVEYTQITFCKGAVCDVSFLVRQLHDGSSCIVIANHITLFYLMPLQLQHHVFIQSFSKQLHRNLT